MRVSAWFTGTLHLSSSLFLPEEDYHARNIRVLEVACGWTFCVKDSGLLIKWPYRVISYRVTDTVFSLGHPWLSFNPKLSPLDFVALGIGT